MKGRLLDLAVIRPISQRSARAELPNWVPAGDTEADRTGSTMRLFENGVEIGPAHTQHDLLEEIGGGCFSHWRNDLIFTSSDDSNPAHNKRRYTALVHAGPLSPVFHILQSAERDYERLINTDEGYMVIERLAAGLAPKMHLGQRDRSFFDDEDFAADYRRFDNPNYRSYELDFAVRELARYAARLPGDMAECGVRRGESAWLMAKALIASRSEDAELHLFDSFSGPTKPHLTGAHLTASLDRVRQNLQPVERVIRYWPGWIPNEFHAVSAKRFSFVHVHVTSAEPTWESLTFFYPRLVDRGMLVCDDYGLATRPGPRAAMDAFAQEANVPVIHLPTGQGLIIRECLRSN